MSATPAPARPYTSLAKDFQTFLLRGNVVDLAVAVVVGAAFGAIVASLAEDVLMPPIGLLLGHVDFNNLFLVLKQGAKAPGPYASLADAKAAGAVTLNYGVFVNKIVIFLIIAAAVFLIVRAISRLRRKTEPPPPPALKQCPLCLSSIPAAARRCAFCTSELVST